MPGPEARLSDPRRRAAALAQRGGGDALLAALAATAVGLALADVTAQTGNLSAAIGLHFANNVLALLVVALPSPISGLALMLAGDPADPGLVRRLTLLDLGTTLAAWAVWRTLRRRRRLHSGGPGSI